MSTSAALIAGCAIVTFAIKAVGPIALGGRELPGWFTGVVVLLAPALLSALIVTQALADGDRLTVGRRHGRRGRRRPGGLAAGLGHRLRRRRRSGHGRAASALTCRSGAGGGDD